MRESRELTLMRSAYLWAGRGTCSRLQVGCVIHRDGRILVQGYNGAPASLPHCDHSCNCGAPDIGGPNDHDDWCRMMQPCLDAVHAEQNAISFAARWGVGLEGAHLTVTHQPCRACAMSIINAGIERVMFQEPYRLKDGLELLDKAGVGIIAGYWPDAVPSDRMDS